MTRYSMMDSEGKLNNFAIEPKMYVDESNKMGFTEYAEKINGRFAMIGFIALLVTEVLTRHHFLN
jgi:Chlorophyll A-B binding protein